MTGGALCRRAFDDLRGATAASRVLCGIDRIENGLFAIEIASVKPIADKHDPVLVTAGLANLKLQAKHRSIASRCGATAPVRLKALKGSARRLRTYWRPIRADGGLSGETTSWLECRARAKRQYSTYGILLSKLHLEAGSLTTALESHRSQDGFINRGRAGFPKEGVRPQARRERRRAPG